MKKFFKSLLLISVWLGLSATVNAKTFRYATTGDILGLDPHANNAVSYTHLPLPTIYSV